MTAKYHELLSYLKGLESVLVAFSGGVDSTFLLKAAKDALGNKVKAYTVATPYIPKWEIKEAKELANSIGVSHEIVTLGVLPAIQNNPSDRCYLCKKEIFSNLLKYASDHGFHYVVDGSNVDDLSDYRPGLKALKELKVVSPLVINKFTKEDIRSLSNELGLPTWDKPPYACLLSRIPYGTPMNTADFELIEQAEVFMMQQGFRMCRVRKHGNIARIEVGKEERGKLLNLDLMDRIATRLKEFGFKYVTMELQGYETGSLNKEINS
jgi:uncharacterized protein